MASQKKIDEFLNDLAERGIISPEVFNEAKKDAKELGDDQKWVAKWAPTFKNDSKAANLYYESGIEKLGPLSERLRKSFGGDFNPSDNWKQLVWEKEFSDIPRERFEETLKTLQKYKEEEIKSRDEEAGKIRRAREIREDWSLPKKILTSGYEQERYIQDPKSATFGKEAPGFMGSSAGSKADLISGGIAAGADFVPGVGAIAGPTIRAGRDVIGHYLIDSPYAKSGSDIIKDVGFDYGANLAAWALPNARRIGRIGRAILGKDAGRYIEVRDMAKSIQEGMNLIDAAPARDAYKTRLAVEAMPDSPLKNEMLEATKNWSIDQVDWNKINEIQNKYARELSSTKADILKTPDELNEAIKEARHQGYSVEGSRLTPYGEKKALSPEFKELPLHVKGEVLVSNIADQLNKGYTGQILVQTGTTASGKRDSGPADKYKKPSFNEAKNWYLKNYERDFDMGFDPRKEQYPDAAKIAAYEEYWENKRKKSGEIYDQWEAKAKELTR